MGQSVRDYEDINENLRYWFDRIVSKLDEPVFYDIGANDGVFSLSLAERCKIVYAFEPAESAFARLRDRLRKFTNVVPYRLALSDASGTMTLNRYSDDTFNSLYTRTEHELSHYSLEAGLGEEVSVRRLDDLVQEEDLAPPDLVKMDIEGAELFALKGAEATIRSGMPVILAEYSVDNTANAGYDRTAIVDLLKSWGYAVRGLYRNTDTTLHESLENRSIWNILCLPRGHEVE